MTALLYDRQTDAINVEMAWVGALSCSVHAHNGSKKMKLE